MKNFNLSANFKFFELTNTHDHPELLQANREYFLQQPYLGRLEIFAESKLEEIRFAVNTLVLVTSCGRSPELNEAVGGVSTSQHLFNSPTDGAADIHFYELPVAEAAYKIYNQGITFFQMRVYEKSNFIHIGSPRSKNNLQIYFPESKLPWWAK